MSNFKSIPQVLDLNNYLNLDLKAEAKKTEEFIKKEVGRTGFKRVVLGLSGGVDSSTVLMLCVKALGAENVLVYILPNGELDKKTDRDIKKLFDIVKIPEENIVRINIKKTIDAIKSQINLINKNSLVRYGNIVARVRMIVLFDAAKKNRALVCGTENKSEYLLGYYTRFGDGASDIEPIRHLYKTQLIGLAKYLGVPEEIINKKATAGLWEGQTDEGEMGFSYKLADVVLYLKLEKKLSDEQIISLGFFKKELYKIWKFYLKNLFKQRAPFVMG